MKKKTPKVALRDTPSGKKVIALAEQLLECNWGYLLDGVDSKERAPLLEVWKRFLLCCLLAIEKPGVLAPERKYERYRRRKALRDEGTFVMDLTDEQYPTFIALGGIVDFSLRRRGGKYEERLQIFFQSALRDAPASLKKALRRLIRSYLSGPDSDVENSGTSWIRRNLANARKNLAGLGISRLRVHLSGASAGRVELLSPEAVDQEREVKRVHNAIRNFAILSDSIARDRFGRPSVSDTQMLEIPIDSADIARLKGRFISRQQEKDLRVAGFDTSSFPLLPRGRDRKIMVNESGPLFGKSGQLQLSPHLLQTVSSLLS